MKTLTLGPSIQEAMSNHGAALYVSYNKHRILTEPDDYIVRNGYFIDFLFNIDFGDTIRLMVMKWEQNGIWSISTLLYDTSIELRPQSSYSWVVTDTHVPPESYDIMFAKAIKDLEPEPKDNDGRLTCYWCKKNTEKIQGFTDTYDMCKRCKK